MKVDPAIALPERVEVTRASTTPQDAFQLMLAEQLVRQIREGMPDEVFGGAAGALGSLFDQHLAEALVHGGLDLSPSPVRGAPQALHAPIQGRVTSDFGMRVHPVLGDLRMHNGIDLAGAIGDPIAAAADGVVRFAGTKGGYGKVLYIDHADGTQTRYAHCDALDVQEGDTVARGQRIGTVGNTGRSTGPHLHFEVRKDGHAVDPAPYLGL